MPTDTNRKLRLRLLFLGIAVGISFGALVGFFAGTFDLPTAVIIPSVVVPVTLVALWYLKKDQDT